MRLLLWLSASVVTDAFHANCPASVRSLTADEALRKPVIAMAGTNPRQEGQGIRTALLSAVVAGQMFLGAAYADGNTEQFKFPPIDRTDKTRCKFESSAIGQSNAARDKLYDLRECKMGGATADTFDLSGALMADGDFHDTSFKEAVMSKIFGLNANFDGADFSNAILDRGYWKGASFKGAIFTNAVLSGSSFEGANVENADFGESYLGMFDQRTLCKNPTLKGENPKTGLPTRESAGCP